MKEAHVRLKKVNKGAEIYMVKGIPFRAGKWVRVPEVIVADGGETFALVNYLRDLTSDDGSERKLFEVTDLDGARRIEDIEREAAEKVAAAQALQEGQVSQVDRAPMMGTPAPEAKASVKPHVDGEEVLSEEEEEEQREAEELRATAAGKDAVAPENAPVSPRRAARRARQQATSPSDKPSE